jgi:hypothetical protein
LLGTENHYRSIYTITVLENGENLYRLVTLTRPSSEHDADPIFEQILSSFRVLSDTPQTARSLARMAKRSLESFSGLPGNLVWFKYTKEGRRPGVMKIPGR